VRRFILALWAPPAKNATVQLVRYGVVVGMGYLLAITLYSGEIAIGVDAYPAFGIVFVLNGLFNFALLRKWAFPPSGRTLISDFSRFCIVAGASFLVNYASFAVLYSGFGLVATTSQRLAILIAAPVTFLANRFWSFRNQQLRQDDPSDDGTADTSTRNVSYSRM
jgi:hypothetical protein